MHWKASKIWDGGDCFIIGGGASLAEQFRTPPDLLPATREEFKQFGDCLKVLHGQKVIGVNLAAFLGPWVNIGFFADSSSYTEFRGWWDEYPGMKISTAGKFSDNKFPSVLHLYRDNKTTFSRNKNAIGWKCGNSGAAAINLAWMLGASRVFLLGFDMQSNKKGQPWWHAGYPDKRQTPSVRQLKKNPNFVIPRVKQEPPFDKHLKNFEELAIETEKVGLEVFNVNPNSRIEAFPKINMKAVFGEPDAEAWLNEVTE